MRKILFRGKRVGNGEWVYGDYGRYAGTHGIENVISEIDLNNPSEGNVYEVDCKTVGQYTGLNDKNGDMIFEGDIIKIVGHTSCYAEVTYSEVLTSYWVENKNLEYFAELGSIKPSFIEVAGNAIDNPELCGTCVKSSTDEMELVNSYSRRELTRDEVYIFSVVLCDNEIDRDFECFTVKSLKKLSKLFVGKTAIFTARQPHTSARIISCKVESVAGKKNSLGDDYFRLTARAYMPVSDSNKCLRESIDSGIVREVSVGCSVEKTVCSICGKEIGACPHIKGETYGAKLCYGKLIEPCDAYEFSFVTMPKQPEVK